MTEAEKDGGRRSKAQVATLEARLAAFDEQLEIEKQDKMIATKNCKRLEKRMKELVIQVRKSSRNENRYFTVCTPVCFAFELCAILSLTSSLVSPFYRFFRVCMYIYVQ